MAFLSIKAQDMCLVVFFSLGLGTTLVSRMVLHLRLWNHSQKVHGDWGDQAGVSVADGWYNPGIPFPIISHQSEMTGIFELMTQQTGSLIGSP